MANPKSTPSAKNKNTPVIILLVTLIVAIVGIGAYFIIKDATKNNTQNTPTTTQTESTNTTANNTTPTDNTNQATDAIEAGITYTEIRGDDYYIEAQTNGVISGVCEITLIPSADGNAHNETDELDAHNKVSTCDEDFDLKNLSSGTYTVRVIINAYDGRTTTLEKYVNI